MSCIRWFIRVLLVIFYSQVNIQLSMLKWKNYFSEQSLIAWVWLKVNIPSFSYSFQRCKDPICAWWARKGWWVRRIRIVWWHICTKDRFCSLLIIVFLACPISFFLFGFSFGILYVLFLCWKMKMGRSCILVWANGIFLLFLVWILSLVDHVKIWRSCC